MRKLIETEQEHLIVCDNEQSDYNIPYLKGTEILLKFLINEPCPKCGENLLTEADFIQSEKIAKAVAFLNKWFSWLTMFSRKNSKAKTVRIHVHNGINIKMQIQKTSSHEQSK